MVFSGIPFLYYFLPCVLVIYFVAPKKLKNLVLFLSSLVFYAWGEPGFVPVMIFTILQGYVFGILIEKSGDRQAKLCLTISVLLSIGILGYCKYANFFIRNINDLTGTAIPLLKVTLPIGISFYTFQIVSYTVDVYRKQVKAQRNFIHLGAYIAMFPQLIAGPIVRYSDIAEQLKERKHSFEKASVGIRRFVLGLSKKVLIANTLGEFCTNFRAIDEKTVLLYWMYAIASGLQIYFDFSGYSDMAIGLGKIFGFDYVENFNYPFISKSVTEFWRRWHISLGTWFRDYVYIPLGGNRGGRGKWLRNILIVWFLTGFWHGAEWTFIAWGMLYSVLLIFEKMCWYKITEKYAVIGRIYLFVVSLIGFVIFSATSVSEAVSYIGAMFGLGAIPFASVLSLYTLRSLALTFVIAMIGATPLVTQCLRKMKTNSTAERILNVLEPIVLLLLLFVSTGYIVDGSFNPFLYFRF